MPVFVDGEAGQASAIMVKHSTMVRYLTKK